MNYYPFHLGDYSSATQHLSWEEDMAYRRLMDVYYQREAPIPLDARQVYRLIRASTDVQRDAVDVVLAEFFEKTPDGWVNSRCDAVLAEWRAKRAKAVQSANARWRNADAKRTHTETDANALRLQSDGNAGSIVAAERWIQGADQDRREIWLNEVPAGTEMRSHGYQDANALRPYTETDANALRPQCDGNAPKTKTKTKTKTKNLKPSPLTPRQAGGAPPDVGLSDRSGLAQNPPALEPVAAPPAQTPPPASGVTGHGVEASPASAVVPAGAAGAAQPVAGPPSGVGAVAAGRSVAGATPTAGAVPVASTPDAPNAGAPPPRTRRSVRPEDWAGVHIARPGDVPEPLWRDFCALRKAKNAPVTDAALAGIRREAQKAGASIEDALSFMAARGHQGFIPDAWARRHDGSSRPDRDSREAMLARLEANRFCTVNQLNYSEGVGENGRIII